LLTARQSRLDFGKVAFVDTDVEYLPAAKNAPGFRSGAKQTFVHDD